MEGEPVNYQQILENVDTLAGLAQAFEDYNQEYREILGDYEEQELGDSELERAIKPVYDTLERTFQTLEELDQYLEQAELEVPVRKGKKKRIFNLEDWVQESDKTPTMSISSFGDAVTFAYLFDDEELEVTEQGLGEAAAALIEHHEYIVETYEQLDNQFDKIIELEQKARENIDTTEPGIYEPEPPLYQSLNGEHETKARGLNREVKKPSAS